MAYVSVDVEIDVNEIDTDDLVNEVCRRLKNKVGIKALSQDEIEELKESYTELANALDMQPTEHIEIKTLDDKIKYEHLANIFSKYSATQIETLLP